MDRGDKIFGYSVCGTVFIVVLFCFTLALLECGTERRMCLSKRSDAAACIKAVSETGGR